MLKQMTLAVWKRHRGVSIILRMVTHIAQTGAVTEIDQNFISLREILATQLRYKEFICSNASCKMHDIRSHPEVYFFYH